MDVNVSALHQQAAEDEGSSVHTLQTSSRLCWKNPDFHLQLIFVKLLFCPVKAAADEKEERSRRTSSSLSRKKELRLKMADLPRGTTDMQTCFRLLFLSVNICTLFINERSVWRVVDVH